MKFQQIPIGARFEFEGRIYVKSGPLTAASEQGGQRMIPRFATLRLLDGERVPEPPRESRPVDAAKVMAAFDAFYRTCIGRVADADGRAELEAARQRFEAAIAG